MAEIVNSSLSPNQLSVLKSILSSKERFHTLVAGRQSGKSYILSRLAFILAVESPKKNIMVLAMDTTQCETVYDHIMDIENIDIVIKHKTKKPMTIILKNGSLITFRTVSGQPNRIRGKSINYVLCDEFAFFQDGIFDRVISPLTKARKDAKVILTSTPFGKSNNFYKFYWLGYDNTETYFENGEELKLKTKGYNSYKLTFEDNPNYSIEQLEEDRLRMPVEVYEEEVLGNFSEGGGEVFKNLMDVCILNEYRVPLRTDYLYAAIDWGMTTDKTVLFIMDNNGEIVYIKSWAGKRPDQINEIKNELKRFNNPILYAEANGIGLPLINQLIQAKVSVNPLNMTNELKTTMVGDLIYDIQTKSVKLPSIKLCEELNNEMNRYTYTKTATGQISYRHRQGENDDFVDALLMVNYVRRLFMSKSTTLTSSHKSYTNPQTGFYR